MNTVSLIVTVVSLALSVSTTVMLLRLRRENRRRADARVAALVRRAGTEMPVHHSDDEPEFLSEPEFSSREDMDLSRDLEDEQRLTADHPQRSWRFGRAIAVGIAATVIVVASVLFLRSGSSEPGVSITPGAQARSEIVPLELVALHQVREKDTVIVSGRIRRTPDGPAVVDVTATVFLFGPDGSFIGSGRDPLDLSALGPGAESSFTVSVPVRGAVARYRVSFRNRTGETLGHVDRRNTSVARNRNSHP